MKKRISSVFIVTVIFSLLMANSASAYATWGFTLTGGVKDRYYYVDPSNPKFSTITSAVAAWNTIDPVYISPSQFSSTDVAFYYTSSVLSSQIDFYTSDYGTTGWL